MSLMQRFNGPALTQISKIVIQRSQRKGTLKVITP